MKNRLYILLILLAFCTTSAYAQQGYLGRNHSLSLGATSNFSLIPFNGGEDYQIEFEDNKQVIFPKIDLAYSIQKKRTVFNFEGRYQMLPNAVQHDFSAIANTSAEIYVKDTIKTRTNVYRLGISIKKFSHVAPIGLYFRFGAGLNILGSKSISRKNTEAYLYDQGIWEIKDEYQTENGFSLIGDVSISVGKVIPLSRRFALDFGLQTNFPIARFKFNNETEGSLLNPIFRKWITGRSLFTHNIIEAYVKVHLFH